MSKYFFVDSLKKKNCEFKINKKKKQLSVYVDETRAR